MLAVSKKLIGYAARVVIRSSVEVSCKNMKIMLVKRHLMAAGDWWMDVPNG
jgi:hypothetical protein